MTNPKLYILFGAPGSGKSESCALLNIITAGHLHIIKKESTRPQRVTDGPEISHVAEISSSCDIRYSQYNYDYGFSSNSIWHHLKEGYSVAVIVNDIRTIKILNRKFGNLAHNIYIHSNINPTKIRKIARARHKNISSTALKQDIMRRIEKIKTAHRKYIENAYLFQSAVINEYERESNKSITELKVQLEHIYNAPVYCSSRFGSAARVIVIAGGSFTGKDRLVNAMIQIEPNKVMAYKKGTTRPKKPGDNDELIHLDSLGGRYDFTYEKNGYQYGVSVNEIWDNLSAEKIVLIVLSDLLVIEKLKIAFPGICTAIYLHANLDPDELKAEKERLSEDEFTKRKRSASELRTAYIENLSTFDHVLLNTSEPEDLYDQAFNILDYYLE